jgi:hypothetical protein
VACGSGCRPSRPCAAAKRGQREADFLASRDGAEIKSPYVFATVFPDAAAVDNALPGLTAAQIKTGAQSLFAAEGMLAHFFA